MRTGCEGRQLVCATDASGDARRSAVPVSFASGRGAEACRLERRGAHPRGRPCCHVDTILNNSGGLTFTAMTARVHKSRRLRPRAYFRKFIRRYTHTEQPAQGRKLVAVHRVSGTAYADVFRARYRGGRRGRRQYVVLRCAQRVVVLSDTGYAGYPAEIHSELRFMPERVLAAIAAEARS
jgi:hypothetical protein